MEDEPFVRPIYGKVIKYIYVKQDYTDVVVIEFTDGSSMEIAALHDDAFVFSIDAK